MTDKVQKIREEVERLKSKLLRGACSSQVAMETRCKEEAYNEVLAILDTMQEEPAPKVFEDMLNAKTAAESLGISPEEHDKIVDECLYGKEPELVDDGDLPKEEPVSEDLEKFAYQSGYAAYPVDMAEEFGGVIRDNNRYQRSSYIKGLKDGAQWQKKKDSIPVSEDLEEAAEGYGIRQGAELKPFAIKFFKAGAKWQKEQFEKSCTDLCNGIATAKGLAVSMAYDKGVADAKEQLMAKAVDVEVKVDAGGYPYIPQIELYDYREDIPLAKEGDKYNIVLIKED